MGMKNNNHLWEAGWRLNGRAGEERVPGAWHRAKPEKVSHGCSTLFHCSLLFVQQQIFGDHKRCKHFLLFNKSFYKTQNAKKKKNPIICWPLSTYIYRCIKKLCPVSYAYHANFLPSSSNGFHRVPKGLFLKCPLQSCFAGKGERKTELHCKNSGPCGALLVVVGLPHCSTQPLPSPPWDIGHPTLVRRVTPLQCPVSSHPFRLTSQTPNPLLLPTLPLPGVKWGNFSLEWMFTAYLKPLKIKIHHVNRQILKFNCTNSATLIFKAPEWVFYQNHMGSHLALSLQQQPNPRKCWWDVYLAEGTDPATQLTFFQGLSCYLVDSPGPLVWSSESHHLHSHKGSTERGGVSTWQCGLQASLVGILVL